jgi:hypothetical protein
VLNLPAPAECDTSVKPRVESMMMPHACRTLRPLLTHGLLVHSKRDLGGPSARCSIVPGYRECSWGGREGVGQQGGEGADVRLPEQAEVVRG